MTRQKNVIAVKKWAYLRPTTNTEQRAFFPCRVDECESTPIHLAKKSNGVYRRCVVLRILCCQGD